MDKENEVVEGQEVETISPETTDTPESSSEIESPAGEVDKDLAEWARNKGFSEEELANPAVLKAAKMAQNAEGFVGKQAQAAEPASDGDFDLDALIDEVMGDSATPETKREAAKTLDRIDESQLTDAERATLDVLREEARIEARKIIAPYESDLRKKQYKLELDGLVKEFGQDVIKNAPAILAKTSQGIPLRDATLSVLNEVLIKQALNKGVEQGKESKAKEISQQVEQSKKADSVTPVEFDKLSLEEQKRVLQQLQT